MAITLDGTNGITTPDLTSSDITVTDIIDASGVYLGGTGSANKLDDYEEGTWTIGTASDPTGVIAANSYGLYVKIGQFVYIQGIFQVSTNFTNAKISGLPFAPINNSIIVSGLHSLGMVRASNVVRYVQSSSSSTDLTFVEEDGTAYAPTTARDPFRFNITYRTTS